MIDTFTAQLIGTICIALFAGILYLVAWKSHWFDRFGKEALLCAASLTMTTAAIRFLVYYKIISQSDARTINGIAAAVFLTILLEILYINRRAKKWRKR